MKLPSFNRIRIFLFLVVLATLSSVPVRAQTKTPANPAAKPAAATAPSANGKAMGSKNAPITMEVFSDFECPACRAFLRDDFEAGHRQLREHRQGISDSPRFPARYASLRTTGRAFCQCRRRVRPISNRGAGAFRHAGSMVPEREYRRSHGPMRFPPRS